MKTASIAICVAFLAALAAQAAPISFQPITKGLNFQLDAKDATAFTVDGDGRVSAWRASAGRAGLAFTNAAPAATRPYRSSLPFGNRGAVVFGYDNDTDKAERPTHLTANGETTNKTVFVAFHRYAGVNYGYTAGGYEKITTAKNDGIYGVVYTTSTRGFYGDTYNRILNTTVLAGGYAWWNGVETSNPTTPTTSDPSRICPTDGRSDEVCDPILFAGEISAAKQDGSTTSFSGITAIGHYVYGKNPDSNYFHGAIAEILSYDRVLTADERNYTFEYLRNKWLGTGAVVVDGDMATVTVAAGERVVLGSIAGAGTLVKRGGGELAFCLKGDDASTVKLQVLAGTVDLAGTTQVVSSVTGNGVVTNSVAARAALVIDNDGASVCEPFVCGNVALVKRGAGALKVSSRQAYVGGTELAGGTLTVVSNVAPASIAGLVMHLDASQLASLTTNAVGEVVSWASSVGDLTATNGETAARHAGCFPVYDKTAFGNRGGVRFGCKPDNTLTGTFLRVASDITHRTAFFVIQPNAAQIEQNVGLYGEFAQTQNGVTLPKNYHRYTCSNTLLMNARSAINGGVQFDGTVETGSNQVYWDGLADGAPHLLSVVAQNDTYVYKPSVGSYLLTNQKYYFWQGVIGEILVYDRVLTENEIRTVECSLMEKWGITPAWTTSPKSKASYPEAMPDRSNPLAADQALTVVDAATIDFSGMAQDVASIPFRRLPNGTLPCLNVIGSLTLSDIDLALPQGSIAPQELMTAQGGTFFGDFQSVTPPEAEGSVVCRPTVVRYGRAGLILLFR